MLNKWVSLRTENHVLRAGDTLRVVGISQEVAVESNIWGPVCAIRSMFQRRNRNVHRAMVGPAVRLKGRAGGNTLIETGIGPVGMFDGVIHIVSGCVNAWLAQPRVNTLTVH